MSVAEYAKSRADAPDLSEIVAAASAAEDAEKAAEAAEGGEGGAGGERAQKRRRIFPDHLRLSELTQGIKEARNLRAEPFLSPRAGMFPALPPPLQRSRRCAVLTSRRRRLVLPPRNCPRRPQGRFHQGALRVSRFNPFEGSVGSDAVGADIFISGRADMNRAMEGDTVVVELLPEAQWRRPSARLPGGRARAPRAEGAAAAEGAEGARRGAPRSPSCAAVPPLRYSADLTRLDSDAAPRRLRL